MQELCYERYQLSKKEWLFYGVQGIFCVGILSYIFYRSMVVFLVMIPIGVCYPLMIRRDLQRKRLEVLQKQFKDAILSVSSCLSAGYSVENAFVEALKETDQIYGNTSMISEELRLICYKTKVNQTIEEALSDFAKRSGLEDVRSFADVFLAAKASGGELMKIIAKTAEIIGEKNRIQEDIFTVTASRRMEQKIMSIVPLFLVCYLEMTSPGFFDVLYTTAVGRAIMSGCMILYMGSIWLSRQMLDISM